MNAMRSIGYTIDCAIDKSKISREELASKNNLTVFELMKLCVGRLFLRPDELKTISKDLNLNFTKLVTACNNDAYKEKIHCRTNFSNPENCDKILDMIDSYIDIKESLR